MVVFNRILELWQEIWTPPGMSYHSACEPTNWVHLCVFFAQNQLFAWQLEGHSLLSAGKNTISTLRCASTADETYDFIRFQPSNPAGVIPIWCTAAPPLALAAGPEPEPRHPPDAEPATTGPRSQAEQSLLCQCYKHEIVPEFIAHDLHKDWCSCSMLSIRDASTNSLAGTRHKILCF